LTSDDASQCVWNSTFYKFDDIHRQTAASVEYLMKNSLIKKTLDNITVVTIALAGLESAISSKTSLPVSQAASQNDLPESRLSSYRMPETEEKAGSIGSDADLERKSTNEEDYSLVERSSVLTTTSIIHKPASKSHFSSMNTIKHLEAIRNASYNTSSKSLKSIKNLLLGKSKKKA